MRLYRALLRTLVETDLDHVARLPTEVIGQGAHGLLLEDQIYVLHQVHKRVDVFPLLPTSAIAAAAMRALGAQRIDDYCFLRAHLDRKCVEAEEPVQTCYRALLRKGLPGGVEQLVACTGIIPRIDSDTARSACETLASDGRPDAIDYVRQLSGLRPDVSAAALRSGAHRLLKLERYTALIALAAYNDKGVRLKPARLGAALAAAQSAGAVESLAAAAVAWDSAGTLTGFEVRLAEFISAHRVADVAAAVPLFADADVARINESTWTALASVRTATALRFVLTHHPHVEGLMGLAATAREVALAEQDRELLQVAVECGEVDLDPDDVRSLTQGAYDSVDLPWLAFVRKRLGCLPPVATDTAQLFLAELEVRDPEALPRAVAIFGHPFDAARGRLLRAVANGDRAATSEFVSHLAMTFGAS